MSKLPAGPAKGATQISKPSAPEKAAPASRGLPLGLKRNHLLGIAAAGALAVGLVVWNPFTDDGDEAAAQGGKKRKGKNKDKDKDKTEAKAAKSSRGICQLVQCTVEQKEAIKPLLQGYQEAVAADEKGLRDAYTKVAEAFGQEAFDDAALEEAYATAGAHQEAIDREARRALAAVHAVLTPEQRDTIGKQVARDGLSSLFEKGGRGLADRAKRQDRRKAKLERPGVAGARAMPGLGPRKPAPGEAEAEEEAEPAERFPSGPPI